MICFSFYFQLLPWGKKFYSTEKRKVTMIPGDGIGPEISAAVVKIFEAANVRIVKSLK